MATSALTPIAVGPAAWILSGEARTPPQTIVTALRTVETLDGLSDEEYLWLAQHGQERKAEPGAQLFNEGDSPIGMTIMLSGEVHIRRGPAGNMSYFIARMGQISGVLPFSRMKGYGGTGYGVGDVWSLDIPRELFPEMLAGIPSMAQRCVTVLLNRVREVTRIELQAEKLTALGKLAANLAHELNNPASAAQRSAASLFGELSQYGQQKYRLGALHLSPEQMQSYSDWIRSARARTADYTNLLADDDNPLAASDREDELTVWLNAHNVPEPWLIAPALAETRLATPVLDELAALLPPEVLRVAIATVASSLRVERLAETVVNSTVRIFDFISAIKDYSYMDQAPIQQVDVAQSLDNTLAMLSSRLTGITIEREYEPGLPHISAYGSEVNQVWTELMANALDAMPHGGTLRIAASHTGPMVVVEIVNTGPKIPPEIVTRIFEPFYTTKPPGKGLGLGLDSVMRIVTLHSGSVSVQSEEGITCFRVRLPIERAEAY